MQIPQYQESTVKMSTQSPMAEQDLNVAAAPGKMISAVGDTVIDYTHQFEKMQDAQEVTSAKTQAAEKIAQIKAQALADPDVWNSGEKARAEIEKVGNEAMKGITSSQAKSEFKLHFTTQAITGMAGLNSKLARKQSDLTKATMYDAIDASKAAITSATSPQEMDIHAQELYQAVDKVQGLGYIHAKEAHELKTKAIQEAYENKAYRDEAAAERAPDPVKATQDYKAALQMGDNGPYRGLTDKQRLERIKAADTLIKKSETTVKERAKVNYDNNEKADSLKFWQGALSKEQLNDDLKSGRIHRSYYDSKMLGLTNPNLVTNKPSHPEAFAKAMDFMDNPKNNITSIENYITSQYNAGLITYEEGKRLATLTLIDKDGKPASLNTAGTRLEELMGYQEQQRKALTDKQSGWGAVWGMIKGVLGSGPAAAKVTQKVMDEAISKNTKPEELHQVAKKMLSQELISQHPEIANYPKEGIIRVDRNGLKTRVYPDGSYEETK